MNEKTIDQIEEVLMCEISDEAVEAAGRVEIAGCGRLFAPAFSAVTCLHLTSFGRRFHHPPRKMADARLEPLAAERSRCCLQGIVSERGCLRCWLPPRKRTERATLPREGPLRVGVPSCTGLVPGSDVLL